MMYDKNKLIALRESIDAYLVKEGQQDMKIYETLERSITAGVAEGVKQAMSEVTTKLDKLLENK